MNLADFNADFEFPDDVIFLNQASFSPAFKSVELAGIKAVTKKRRPDLYQNLDLFEPLIALKKKFAQIINLEDYQRVANIPSVSYGLANAAKNIALKPDDEIVVIEEQFPSNIYTWIELSKKFGAKLVTIKQPDNPSDWNDLILNAINENTRIVAMAHVHWANDFIFNLKSIRKKTKDYESLLIVDASQSLGALPFSVKEIKPDVLVCAGYKWLFGPYGCAYAYYGEYFDNGKPIEENWSIRSGSENLASLTQYSDSYKPLAQRYNAGESASFIYIQMQLAALEEVLKFRPEDLQAFCLDISSESLKDLDALGFKSFPLHLRANHLFGLSIPASINHDLLKNTLKANNIIVSYRGNYLRVSAHLYNTKAHFKKLVNVLKQVENHG